MPSPTNPLAAGQLQLRSSYDAGNQAREPAQRRMPPGSAKQVNWTFRVRARRRHNRCRSKLGVRHVPRGSSAA